MPPCFRTFATADFATADTANLLTSFLADVEAVWVSPAAVCLLWVSRRLKKSLRLAVAATMFLAVSLTLLLADSTTAQQANGGVVLICAVSCMATDLFRRQNSTSRSHDSEAELYISGDPEIVGDQDRDDAGRTASALALSPPVASGDEVTNVIDTEMVLNLEDLAPEIDAVSAEEFTRRVSRVGVFSTEQVAALEKLIDRHRQLSAALKEGVTKKILTVYQALHLLWGKEDRLIIGPYVLANVLGVGGMSVVYRARKLAGGAEIALKVVPKATKHEARFRREMHLAQLLAHPNIVVAYEVGETVDRYFIAMELVLGRNLQDVVRFHGNLSEAVALQYVLQAARGLEHAHERGIIHRDVKPGNLLLCSDGTIKVADLGLSQETGDVDAGRNAMDAVSGTIDFMAPEQANPSAKSVPQIDIYGLGTTLFYLLTGKPHVVGRTTTEKLMNLTVSRRFKKLPRGTVKAATSKLLRKLTAWEPAKRFSTVSEVIMAIESILENMGRDYAPRSIHVLVVEGDSAHVFPTVRLLSRTNPSIRASKCDTLPEAIEMYAGLAATSERVDLVVLSLDLSKGAGVDRIVELRNVHKDAAIIVLGNTGPKEFVAECRAAGANGFLSKSDLTLGTLERKLFTIQSQNRNGNLVVCQ